MTKAVDIWSEVAVYAVTVFECKDKIPILYVVQEYVHCDTILIVI